MSETTKKVSGQRAGATAVKSAIITSKTDTSRQVNVAGGFIEFRYYESILSNTVSATATILETGYSTNQKGKTRTKGTILDQLPVRGGERAVKKLKMPMEVNLICLYM